MIFKWFYEGSKNYRCVVRMGLGRGRKIPILLLKAEVSKNDNNCNNYNPGRGGTRGVGKGEIQHGRRRSGRGVKETHNLKLWEKSDEINRENTGNQLKLIKHH